MTEYPTTGGEEDFFRNLGSYERPTTTIGLNSRPKKRFTLGSIFPCLESELIECQDIFQGDNFRDLRIKAVQESEYGLFLAQSLAYEFQKDKEVISCSDE